jgi:hypothetical protein
MGKILPIAITFIASIMDKENKPKWGAKRKKGFDTRNQGTMIFLGVDSEKGC